MTEARTKEFEMSQGLLDDVMRKQAGTVSKAVLEAVMNAVDAGASNITISISERTVQVIDDGDGMEEEEIHEQWTKFGKKGEDLEDKEFGKFRMGRGQIFNFGRNIWYTLDNAMVVDLNNEEATIDHYGEEVTVQTSTENSDLAYAILKIPEEAPEEDGTRVSVQLYEELDDVSSTEDEVEKLIYYIPWVHDVNVTLNGDEVYHEPDEARETELAWFTVSPSKMRSMTSIYNKGAYVTRESITNCAGVIISKVDLDVNMSRDSVLDTDENIEGIYNEYKKYTKTVLLESDDLSASEEKWLLEEAAEDSALFNAIVDKPLIPDVEKNYWSISDLGEARTVAPGPVGNSQAEAINGEDGVVIIDSSYDSYIQGLIDTGKIVEYEEAIETETKWEMQEYDYSDLSKTRRQNFDRAEWLLHQVGFYEDIKPGYSMHADAWKVVDKETEEVTLYIDKSFLKKKKQDFILEAIPHIVEVAAQDGDTRHGLEHGFNFKSTWWWYSEDLGEYQNELLKGNAP